MVVVVKVVVIYKEMGWGEEEASGGEFGGEFKYCITKEGWK